MLKKIVFLSAVAGSTAGLPYLVSNGGTLREKVYDTFGRPSTVLPSSDGIDAQSSGLPQAFGDSMTAPNLPLAPPIDRSQPLTVQPIQAALRWDVTPAWILGNWPRVSTSLAELDMQGYRVALVTGTTEGDLAGSLTYYFDREQRLQRIAFQGKTGDARPLVDWLTSKHQFTRMLGPDPQMFLYQAKQGRQVISELRITNSPVVRQGQPHERFDVWLLMGRPSE
jgi:hypothetical protein